MTTDKNGETMATFEPVVFLRDALVPASQAKIAYYDYGIVLGATVTDLVRTYGHKPFRLDDHLNRFYESCKYARIQPLLSLEESRAVIFDLLRHNLKGIGPSEELAIVMFITPGELPVYAGLPQDSVHQGPTFCIHTYSMPMDMWRPLFREGAHVVIPSIRHIPPECIDPKAKNRSRLHWWMADQETRLVDPKAITVLLDLGGNISEASGANFLIAKKSAVISPTSKNILLGISLLTIQELCSELQIPFIQKDLQVHDVVNADEAFLSTTPYGIAPVTKVNGISICDGKPGPIFRRITEAWSQKVGMDVLAQIMEAEKVH